MSSRYYIGTGALVDLLIGILERATVVFVGAKSGCHGRHDPKFSVELIPANLL